MELIKIEDKYFLHKKVNNIYLVTTTANSEFGINPKLENYKRNMEFIKKSFSLNDIFRASQTHSSIVLECDREFKNGIEGDALISSEKNYAIGVFTADCVPIFVFDINKQVISVVHSGWKGTYNEIIINVINKFIDKYKSNPNDIMIYIGPHNMSCCYEVGDDLKDKFINHKHFVQNNNIFNGDNLNLLECIKTSILHCGIPVENIEFTNYCTYCSNDVKFYSYRRDKESLDRIFSFIFIK